MVTIKAKETPVARLVSGPPLTRKFAMYVALADLGAGVTGLILSPSHFQSESYKPARNLLDWLPGDPSRWWSWILVCLALSAFLLTVKHSSKWMRNYFSMLCGFWMFWTILYAFAWGSPNGGPWGPWLAVIAVIGNSRPVVTRALAN